MEPTFDSDNYNEDLTPKRCYKCGCATFQKKDTDSLDGYIMAFKLSCLDCGVMVQSWDTGHYDSEIAWLSNGNKEFGRDQ